MQAIKVAVLEALDSSEVQASDIAAVAVSGQQHGLVPLSSTGAVLDNAKLWCDTEAAPQAAALSKQLGWSMPAAFTAAKLKWLQEERPSVYELLSHVLLPHDYVNYWLTGELAMEVCPRRYHSHARCRASRRLRRNNSLNLNRA